MKRLLFIFLFVSQSVFGWGIVDPSCNEFFDKLFSAKGEVVFDREGNEVDWPAKRLQALLNSILKPAFKIEVLNLEYKTVKYKRVKITPNLFSVKKSLFDIFIRCKCRYIEDAKAKRLEKSLKSLFLNSYELDFLDRREEDTFYLDIKIQRDRLNMDEESTLFYGNLMDVQTFELEEGEEGRVKSPKTMVISILDGVLSGYKGKAIFYIGPCVKDILNFDPEKSEVKDGALVQLSPIQLFVQLPVFCKMVAEKENGLYIDAIKNFKSTVTNKENEDDYTTNEWLLLLGSRRLCCGLNAEFASSGKYEVNTGFFSNNEVKYSISALNKMDDRFYRLAAARYQYDLQMDLKEELFTEALRKRNKKLENENAQLKKQLTKRSQPAQRKKIKQSVQKGDVMHPSKFTHKKKLRFFQDSTKK